VKELGRYAGVGFEFVMTIAIGFFAGRFGDRHLGTHYLIWVGVALGTVVGFVSMFRAAKAESKRLENEDKEKGPPPGVSDDEYDKKDWGEDHRDDKEPKDKADG
jgi:hypothetical protein